MEILIIFILVLINGFFALSEIVHWFPAKDPVLSNIKTKSG